MMRRPIGRLLGKPVQHGLLRPASRTKRTVMAVLGLVIIIVAYRDIARPPAAFMTCEQWYRSDKPNVATALLHQRKEPITPLQVKLTESRVQLYCFNAPARNSIEEALR